MSRKETLASLILSELRGTKGQREWALAAIAEQGPELLDCFCDALREEVPAIRAAAAEALGWVGEARAIGPLLETLHDSQEWVRWTAAMALGQLGAKAVPALGEALQAPDPGVRCLAAKALGRTGASLALPPLRRALGDPAWQVRQAAAEALGLLGARQAQSDLCRALEDPHPAVCWAAAHALGKVGDAQALESLGRAALSPDWGLHWAALQALRSLLARLAEEPQRDALIPLRNLDRLGLDADLRRAVRQALRRLEEWLQEIEGHLPAGALSQASGPAKPTPGPASLSRSLAKEEMVNRGRRIR